MSEFRFDKENHAYYLGREKLPSTTGILQKVGIYTPSGFTTEYDMWVGSASHRAIELHVKGTLDEDNLDKQLRPRLTAYRQFQEATGFIPFPDRIERPYYSELWRYGFTPDLVGRFSNGDIGIVDLKSGSVDPATAIQTASYAHGLSEYEKSDTHFRRFGLQVSKEGRPTLVEFTDHKDLSVWMNALSIFNWIRNNRRVK